MKKKALYLLTSILVIPLVGCGNAPTPAPTYKVTVDPEMEHVNVTGNLTNLHGGDEVSLKVTVLNSYRLCPTKFLLYGDNEEKKNIPYFWDEENLRINFIMPNYDVFFFPAAKDPVYDVVFDEKHRLEGGDITYLGTYFHFDENSIEENPSEGFIEIGSYGSLYLENYVPGISEIYVEAKYDGTLEDKGFVLGSSSTPNNVEFFTWYSQTDYTITMDADRPYFSIHNRSSVPLIIKSVKMKYEENDPEAELKELIKVTDKETYYKENVPIDPYEDFPIDASRVPENRDVRRIKPMEIIAPGEYVFGYEVYIKKGEDKLGKLLYSSTANYKVKGTEDGKHLAIFHLKDKIVTIPVADRDTVDISSNLEVSEYNWRSEFNDFTTPFTSDRHFYPVYSVVGLPNHKNGDGCEPVTETYNAFDAHIDMPDPVMMDGYTFGGWFLDQECHTPFDPDGSYKGDITLYANCIERTSKFRKVYYYDYDGTPLNRVDYIDEKEDAELTLPTFEDIGTQLVDHSEYETKMYELRMGANRVKMLRPAGQYPIEEQPYAGDKLKYTDIKDIAGDIKLTISKAVIYTSSVEVYTIFFKDLNQNTVVTGFKMDEEFNSGDRIIPGRYVDWDKDWSFTYNTYYDPQRSDEFVITDAVEGYIIDQGSFNAIATYGYGNKFQAHSKPLQGILRHESVLKVNRRAFFNRYGMVGTYFPRNAREFALESYSNTHFNGRLLLPKSLVTIGPRAFVGSTNIKSVCLPKTIKSIGVGAFSLGDYNEDTFEFENVRYREGINDKIVFYYEGSEKDFNRLDESSKKEIRDNASKIVFNASYSPYYGR